MGAGTFSKTTFQLNMHKTLNKPASIHGRACGSINTDKTISYQKNLKLKVERLYCHINFVFFSGEADAFSSSADEIAIILPKSLNNNRTYVWTLSFYGI